MLSGAVGCTAGLHPACIQGAERLPAPCSLPGPSPCHSRPAGLVSAHATPLKPHPGAGPKAAAATPLEARTPVSAAAARSSAGRRPLSADTGTPGPGEGLGAAAGGDGGKEDSNPLAFLAIAASMEDE